MNYLKLFLKRRLIDILKLSGRYKKANYLPEGKISLKDVNKDLIVYTSDSKISLRKLPVTIGAVPKNFISKLKPAPWKTFVIKAQNWKVWGNQGAVLTSDNHLFSDVSREFDDKVHSIFNQLKLVKPVKVEGNTTVLAASGASVYYHWMMDILPRINFLKISGLFDTIDKFVINYQGTGFQKETLLRAGIDLKKIIPANDHWGTYLLARELIIPSLPSPNDAPSLEACLYLRKLYAAEIEDTGQNEKIYIQRLNGRKVVNEDELLPWLKAEGFEIVNAERLTVTEQASLFAGAKVVMGPHGAGLTNIVFCKPGTVVIDLFAPEWINPCYWIIAENIGLRYGYLIGEQISNKKETPKGANIYLDIKKLNELIAIFDKDCAVPRVPTVPSVPGTTA